MSDALNGLLYIMIMGMLTTIVEVGLMTISLLLGNGWSMLIGNICYGAILVRIISRRMQKQVEVELHTITVSPELQEQRITEYVDEMTKRREHQQ